MKLFFIQFPFDMKLKIHEKTGNWVMYEFPTKHRLGF